MVPENPQLGGGSTPRRFFLQTAGLVTAGLAVGAGAAWLKGLFDQGATAQTAARDLQTNLASAQATETALQTSASTLQGQVTDLQNRLTAAISQNADLSSALSAAQADASAAKVQLASAQRQAEAAETKLKQFQELLALYEQLEKIGVDTLIQTGLIAMGAGVGALLNPGKLLRDGLRLAETLLATFEKTLTDFNAAMAWLSGQHISLGVALRVIELALQKLLSLASGNAGAIFVNFVTYILDHLPFNIGEQVRAPLNATHSLLTSVEKLLAEASAEVFAKIQPYVNDGPQDWKTTLTLPLRIKTLAPAADLLSAAAQADTTFTSMLDQPLNAALKDRTKVREQITAFRTANKI